MALRFRSSPAPHSLRARVGACVGACVWVWACATAAHAQALDATPVRLNLAQAYAHALVQDATLRATQAQTEGVVEQVEQARAQLRPRLSLSASRFHNDLDRSQPNLLGQISNSQEKYYSNSQSLQLRQPLYRPALSWGVDMALAQQAQAQAVLAREVQTLGVKVVEAYVQVLLAQDQEALLRQQMQLAVQQLQSAQKRWAGGQGIRTDIDEAQARLDLLEAQQLEARQAQDTALLQLQSLTQQPVQAVQALHAEALDMDSFAVQTPAYWMDKAQANSPDIQALQARLQSAQLDVQRSQTGHQPTIDALWQISRNASENVTATRSTTINRQIGVQVELPLYAGGAVQSATRQALSEQARLQATLEATERALSLSIQREWRGVTESARRSQALVRAVASADLVVVSVKRSLEAGFRTVLDVLNAEQQAYQARRDLNEARLRYVASRLRLQALVGELDGAQLEQANRWFQR